MAQFGDRVLIGVSDGRMYVLTIFRNMAIHVAFKETKVFSGRPNKSRVYNHLFTSDEEPQTSRITLSVRSYCRQTRFVRRRVQSTIRCVITRALRFTVSLIFDNLELLMTTASDVLSLSQKTRQLGILCPFHWPPVAQPAEPRSSERT